MKRGPLFGNFVLIALRATRRLVTLWRARGRQLMVVICLPLFFSPAVAQERPNLADELRAAIESGGASAARQRFDEIYPDHKDDYVIDLQSIMMMASEYIVTGQTDVADVIGEVNARIGQDMISDAWQSASPDVEEQFREMDRLEQERIVHAEAEEQRVEEEVAARRMGKTRDDLGRFTGLYGEAGSGRQLFVMPSCDGYLVVGPMWADVGPWRMRSAADLVFTYADSFFHLAVEFRSAEGGEVESIVHDLRDTPNPMHRVGPLPSNFGDCTPPPLR